MKTIRDLFLMDAMLIDETQPRWYFRIRGLLGPIVASRYTAYFVIPYNDGRPKNVWGISGDLKGLSATDKAYPLLRNGNRV